MEPIALHRAVFAFPSGVSLDIESALGNGKPLDNPPAIPRLIRAEAETQAESLSSGGMVPMRWLDSGALFERYQLREDTDYYVDVTVPLVAGDAESRSKSHPAWPFDARLTGAFRRDPVRRWKSATVHGKPATVVTGQLRLRSHAGVLAFGTEFGESFFAEVACRKLKYFDEFKELLDSLADELAELLLAFDSPVSMPFSTDDKTPEKDAALHFLMRMVMSEQSLPVAADEITASPHSRIYESVEIAPIEEMEEPEPELIVDRLDVSCLANGGPLGRFFGGYTPKELPRREIRDSVDTPENRYAKSFLEHCRALAQSLELRMGSRKRKAAEREARVWTTRLDEILQRGLWKDVGELTRLPANSQILLRKRGYKELFRFDAALRASLALAWKEGARMADGLVGDIRPVNQIYEYWCFFALRKIILGFCRHNGGGNFIVVAKDGLRVQLAKGTRSECRFEFLAATGTSVTVSLFYNKRFRRPKKAASDWSGSYTAAFDPDFSVSATPVVPGGKTHWLHFDAKYRLDRREVEEIFEAAEDEDEDQAAENVVYESELARVHKQDDLFKMHTYRDGILSSRGAYVLFPGDGSGGKTDEPGRNLFVRHPSAFGGTPAHKIPSVGAFDLTPNGAFIQTAAIRELLMGAFELAASSSTYEEENAFFR